MTRVKPKRNGRKWFFIFSITMLVIPLLTPLVCVAVLIIPLTYDEGYSMTEAERPGTYFPSVSHSCRALPPCKLLLLRLEGDNFVLVCG